MINTRGSSRLQKEFSFCKSLIDSIRYHWERERQEKIVIWSISTGADRVLCEKTNTRNIGCVMNLGFVQPLQQDQRKICPSGLGSLLWYG